MKRILGYLLLMLLVLAPVITSEAAAGHSIGLIALKCVVSLLMVAGVVIIASTLVWLLDWLLD